MVWTHAPNREHFRNRSSLKILSVYKVVTLAMWRISPGILFYYGRFA